jgi:tetratricopeptide (TPR) repeat protein
MSKARASRWMAVIGMLLAAAFVVVPARAAQMDALSLLRAGKFQELDDYYSAFQRQFDAGKISGDELRNEFRSFYRTDRDLEAKLDGWVRAFPKSYVARLARAIYYKRVGFEERGEEYISKTSAERIRNMDSALGKAIRDFGASMEMERKPFLSYFHVLDISNQYAGVPYTRQLYEKAVALSPTSFGLRLKFMKALEAKWGGSLQEMRAFMEECRNAHLPDPQLHQLQAMVYEDEGWEDVNYHNDLVGAEAAYRKALEQAANECETCVHADTALILVLMKLGKYADAISYLNSYLRAHPGDLWALANRGTSYMQSGSPREAIADWNQAAAAGDDYSEYRLGMAYMTGIPGILEGDTKIGVEWLRKSAEQGNADAKRSLPWPPGSQAQPRAD